MYILKEVCHMTASFPAIYFSIIAIYFFFIFFITSRQHLKRSSCQGLCVCFTTLVAAMHYKKRSVGDSRKLKGMFIGRNPLQPCFLKDAYLIHRTSCSNFCLKSTVINTRKHFPILSFFNLTISQQQLQLFIKYSKFFRKATADICTCRGDFRSIYFSPKSCSFGVLIAPIFFRRTVVFENSYC